MNPKELDRLRHYYESLSDASLARAYAQGPGAYRDAEIWELVRALHAERGLPEAVAAEPAPPGPTEPSPPATLEVEELATVFVTGDLVALALAKAALDANDIPFVTQGEGVQDLIGFGRFPGGFNLAVGGVRVHVHRRDADRAREVLADIDRR